MRAWTLLLALAACDTDKDDTSEATDILGGGETVVDEGCATWVVCCEHQCTTQSEYEAYLKDPYDCDVECDTASPGPLPGECLTSGDTCTWQ